MSPDPSKNQGIPDTNRLEKCRSLVRDLTKKTETLYRECRSDRDKVMHIRSMVSTLAALTAAVNRLDSGLQTLHAPDVLRDAHGFTYESVRSCDLDRLSDK